MGVANWPLRLGKVCLLSAAAPARVVVRHSCPHTVILPPTRRNAPWTLPERDRGVPKQKAQWPNVTLVQRAGFVNDSLALSVAHQVAHCRGERVDFLVRKNPGFVRYR